MANYAFKNMVNIFTLFTAIMSLKNQHIQLILSQLNLTSSQSLHSFFISLYKKGSMILWVGSVFRGNKF